MQDIADISCKACTSELQGIRKRVKQACKDFALSDDKTSAVVLAIDEACANVIRHSCAFSDKFSLEVKVSREKNYGVFLIIDNCPPISAECLQPKQDDPLQPGGLGLHIIRQVMDSVKLLPHNGSGNTLELKIKI
jgi:serine/threonine-protein kinase RsbW